jgi:hypothetical protein
MLANDVSLVGPLSKCRVTLQSIYIKVVRPKVAHPLVKLVLTIDRTQDSVLLELADDLRSGKIFDVWIRDLFNILPLKLHLKGDGFRQITFQLLPDIVFVALRFQPGNVAWTWAERRPIQQSFRWMNVSLGQWQVGRVLRKSSSNRSATRKDRGRPYSRHPDSDRPIAEAVSAR